MAEQDEREFLRGVFLMEAWDTVGALEAGLVPLGDPAVPPKSTVSPLLVLAHRLKGSAALHGFPALSQIAETAEILLESTPDADLADRAELVEAVHELLAVSKEQFDRIGATGAEDAERIAQFLVRRSAPEPAWSPAASPTPTEVGREGAGVEGPSASEANRPPLGIAEKLNRFFAENADVLPYFTPEAAEHLELITTSWSALERDGRTEEHLANVFRAVHTLKGAAYTVGCAPVGDVAHEIEDCLVALREGRVGLTSEVVEAMLASADALKLALQSAGNAPPSVGVALERARQSVRALMQASPPVASAIASAAAAQPAAPAFLALGPATVPVLSGRAFQERTSTAGLSPSIRVGLDRLDSLMNLIGELMIAHSRFDQRLAQFARVGGLLGASRARLGRVVREFETKRYDSRLAVHRPGDGDGSRPLDDIGASLTGLFAELEFDRHDDFSTVAGGLAELLADIGEAQTQQTGLLRALRDDVAQIQRLTAALRKEVTRSRMVHFGSLFARLARQVREAAREAGKTVTFEAQGESVNIDGSIIDHVSDPLLHLLQNAVSHGIEPDHERLARGKAAAGRIHVRARQEGPSILIEVGDDGRGMDEQRLRRQAVERGLLSATAAEELSATEALDLVFTPGFSTAAMVTRAAGRGVGLDVVRTNVNRLNGEVLVETEAGVGTRFTLKFPVTTVIADALMVRVGRETMAIPLASVQVLRCVDPGAVQAANDRESVPIDGEPVDLIRLGSMLGMARSETPSMISVAMLRSGGRAFAVAVDELLGTQEIVVKRLGDVLDGVGPYAGATISSDGQVILLLDPSRLLGWDRAADRRSRGKASATPAAVEARERAPRRILLVDDSVSVRRFVGQMLERAGFEVLTAVDGQDALERLTEITVDLIVTDLEMPRVHGYALIEDLRRRPATRDVPIVILTTRAGAKHRDLARRLGVRHYVTKPVDDRAFVGLIDSIVTPAVPDPLAGGVAHR